MNLLVSSDFHYNDVYLFPFYFKIHKYIFISNIRGTFIFLDCYFKKFLDVLDNPQLSMKEASTNISLATSYKYHQIMLYIPTIM